MRLGGVSFCLLLCICIGGLILGKNGYLDYCRLRQTEQQILNQNKDLLKANQELKAKISRLKSDPAYLKYIIRHQMGLIDKDEIMFCYGKD
jgi:cell division protein FtsB